MIRHGKQLLLPEVGTEIKIGVLLSIPGIESLTMDDYDFVCEFFTARDDTRTFSKSEMVRCEEKDKKGNTIISYIAVLDTTDMKPGRVRGKVTAKILDADCEDNYRTEIAEFNTGIQIFRRL